MIELKHLCAYLPYGLKFYPSEKSDLFHDIYADHAMDSTWNYIHALENKDTYALSIKQSYLIPCDPFLAIEDGEIFLGQFKSSLGFDVDDVFLSEVKPILRPMSDLKKDEWSPYVKLWDLSYLQDIGWGTDLNIDGPTSFWGIIGNYSMFESFFKNHLDIFDLIGQGLAISIHDLEK